MSENSLTQLKAAFTKALQLPDGVEFATLEYGKCDEWDSIAHMQLIVAIEETFHIMLDAPDVIGLSSFKVAIELLKKYGVHIAA